MLGENSSEEVDDDDNDYYYTENYVLVNEKERCRDG